MITKTTGLVALLFYCASCAGISNTPYTHFEVITNTPAQAIVEKDTLTPHEHKAWFLHISIPYFNSFYLQPDEEDPQLETGFWGVSLGADYHYRANRSVHFSASGASSFFLPVVGAVDISGEWQIAGSWFVTAVYQHHWNRLQLGYGLCFARNVWEWKYSEAFDPPPPTRPIAYRQSNSLGIQLSSYVRTGKRFHLGAFYRPTFLRFNSSEKALAYEHLISLDLAWKFRLN